MISRRTFNGVLATSVGVVASRRVFASEPIATTATGRVRGLSEAGVNIFKGIPYGASTGGDNRWLPAKDPVSWTGVRDTQAYGPAAAQIPSALFTDPQMSEDCLVLNVWSQGLADSGKRESAGQ